MNGQTLIRKARRGETGLSKRLWRKVRAPLARSSFVADATAAMLVAYLRLVHRTNRLVHFDTARADEIIRDKAPFIVTGWHGQHFMAPLHAYRGHPSVVMVSRSKDAELNARVVERLGLQTVRGSGGRIRTAAHEKGAVRALIALRNHLRAGRSVTMIADIPHGTPREAGMGVISLARLSGVPIVPIAYASSRRYVFENAWDKAVLNLPFGRAALCIGDPIEVPPDANDEVMEQKRKALQASLNRITEQSYALVDQRR